MEPYFYSDKLAPLWDYILETNLGYILSSSHRTDIYLEIRWKHPVDTMAWINVRHDEYRISEFSYKALMKHPDPRVIALLIAATED